MSATKISWEDVQLHPASFRDESCKVFFWEGGLYRGLSEDYLPVARKLFDEDLMANIIDKGMFIDTEWTDFKINGYSAVVKHRLLPFVSYPFEWCGEMLRDAALLVIDLEIELAKHGFTLLDPHPRNILFDGCQPIYVDLGSIDSAGESDCWNAYSRYFEAWYLHPLRLWFGGYGRIARVFLQEYDLFLSAKEVNALVGMPSLGYRIRTTAKKLEQAIWGFGRRCRYKVTYPRSSGLHQKKKIQISRSIRVHELNQLRGEVERMKLPAPTYLLKNELDTSLIPSEEWNPLQRVVHQILNDLHPRSVMDIGSGGGWYARLAAHMGMEAIAISSEDRRAGHCYDNVRQNNLSVLPLVLDIRFPSAGMGLCNEEFPSATVRLRSDLVIAMGMPHRLDGDEDFRLEQISLALKEFSKKWLLIEFTKDEKHGDSAVSAAHSGESYEPISPVKALSRFFTTVLIINTDVEGSLLLFCENPMSPCP